VDEEGMVEKQLQERFARHCTDAAFGYATAATAAYAAFADQVFGFWADALKSPERRETRASPSAWGWPWPMAQPATSAWAPFAWAMPQGFPAPTSPFGMPGTTSNPFAAWLGMFPFAAAPAAWPMAYMFMASGMPSSVAWPTAEANVAAMEAVDVATVTVRQAFSSYRTDGGHASAQQGWPAAHLLMLAVLTPLSVGAMLANGR
jgi:hypothetical protein